LFRLKLLTLTFLFILLSCTADRKLNNPQDKIKQYQCDGSDYYIDYICDDEKVNLDWAASYPKYRKLKDLNRATLLEIMKESGSIDKAAAVFYHRAITDPLNKKLIDYIHKKDTEFTKNTPDFSSKNLLFAIAPGMFYKDNTEVDADGRMIRGIVRQMGISEAVIQTDQSGTVEKNGKIICEFIKSHTEVNGIIIGSASKGSGDFKKAIEFCGNEPYFERLKGWFNFGGINKGSLIVNGMMDHWLYRMEGKLYFWLFGYNWDGLVSMRGGENAPLSGELVVPKSVVVVNIVGIPTYRLVTDRARPFYNYLAQFGPNEGINLLSDSHLDGIPLYPSWRNDHYFRLPVPEGRIKAFIAYIVEKQSNVK
jgi:hypothetical protein